FVVAEGVPTARAEGSKASDHHQGPPQPSTARGCVLRLGIVRSAALARPPSSRVLTLTRHRLVARAPPRGGLRSHWTRLACGRCGPLHRGLARREDDHGRTPVWKTLTPQQICRLQMAELDELRQLRIGQGPELLAIACEIPL